MDKQNIRSLIDNYNFVVPEIQREYVWGAAKNKSVFIQFVKDLNAKLQKGDTNIGFLYSYKSGVEHYLIDGQQRYTTLILMLYFIAASNGNDCLSKIDKILRIDEREQAFSYRVRSFTESFLHNLLKSGIVDSKVVRDQIWFKNEYNEDPTIESMLGALDTFNSVIGECPNITLDNILNNIYFWYFDVDQTSQGEELYITMNSRGEKLTDSEQIKPRLFRKENDKEAYGKKWDQWEEFFYKKDLRGDRPISSIDIAMNNIIRVVLELKTQKEHDEIKPIDDSNIIDLHDIEKYMDALDKLYELKEKKYSAEIARLYGDSNSDRNFYTLKGLLVEMLKVNHSKYEIEQIYQTIINQVRRNKLKNISYLNFLENYKNSSLNWYDFILLLPDSPDANVITGHEYDKIHICKEYGQEAENAIWEEQSCPFWNGDIKPLITWSKVGDKFNLAHFKRLCHNFNLLFDQPENSGWTSDSVRQALLTRRLPDYPINGIFFGFDSSQWKAIMNNNSKEFHSFLNCFDDADKDKRDAIIADMKRNYPETPDNPWAEFVQHDYLLQYCNTKRIQTYRKEYGIECVKNSYKQPYSVKNMHLFFYLTDHISELNDIMPGWYRWEDSRGWKSVIKVCNNSCTYDFYIEYRKDHSEQYEIELVIKNQENSKDLIDKANLLGFTMQDEHLKTYVSQNLSELFDFLKKYVKILPNE